MKRTEAFARDFVSTGLHKRLALLHAEIAASLLERIGKTEAARGEEEVIAHVDIAVGLSGVGSGTGAGAPRSP